jgi:hypothetical protein
MLETVGNESSSLTNGSSVVRVAGKNLLPAKPCAHAAVGTIDQAAAQITIVTADAFKGLQEKFCFNWNSFLWRERMPRRAIGFLTGVGSEQTASRALARSNSTVIPLSG